MRCSNCGSENPSDAAFCEQCGRKLELLCPACRETVSADARFCRKCGTSLSAVPVRSETIAASPSPGAGIRLLAEQTVADVTGGERKTVTALFADIKGSMELMEALDPEEARALIDPALKLMIEAVHSYDGYVIQSTGDGIFALFGAPVAHEDHPQLALYAALRMQGEIERYSAKLRQAGQLPWAAMPDQDRSAAVAAADDALQRRCFRTAIELGRKKRGPPKRRPEEGDEQGSVVVRITRPWRSGCDARSAAPAQPSAGSR